MKLPMNALLNIYDIMDFVFDFFLLEVLPHHHKKPQATLEYITLR